MPQKTAAAIDAGAELVPRAEAEVQQAQRASGLRPAPSSASTRSTRRSARCAKHGGAPVTGDRAGPRPEPPGANRHTRRSASAECRHRFNTMARWLIPPARGGSSSRLTPEEITNRGFASAFRGISETEVRNFLRRVADEIVAHRGPAKRTWSARSRTCRSSSRNPPAVTEQQLLESLGEETARVLRSAQEAAEEIRKRAEERAGELVREAQESAERSSAQDAEQHAKTLRTEMPSARAEEIEEQAEDGGDASCATTAEREAEELRERARRETARPRARRRASPRPPRSRRRRRAGAPWSTRRAPSASACSRTSAGAGRCSRRRSTSCAAVATGCSTRTAS